MAYILSLVPRAKTSWHSSDGLGVQWTDTKSVLRGPWLWDLLRPALSSRTFYDDENVL